MVNNIFDSSSYEEMMGIKKKPKRKIIPKSIKDEVLVKQNYKCAKCKKTLPARKHFHHKKPVSKGGKNTISNIEALCPNCHSKHHHKESVKKANAKERKRNTNKKSNNPLDINWNPPNFKF